MIAVCALLLALQGEPKIESVERVAGAVHRPLLWAPLKITLSSSEGYKGEIVARSGFGFSVLRDVTIAAGGKAVVLLPALDPVEITAGKATFKVPRDLARPDRVVLVDARLPYAGELATSDKVYFQKIALEDLEKTLPRGLLEVADLVLLKEPMAGGLVAPTREDAEKAVAALDGSRAALELVDRAIWPLAPGEGWVKAKQTWTLYFATVYGFAAFVALALGVKRYPKFAPLCIVGLAGLGLAAYAANFPRRPLSSQEQGVEVISPAGDVAEHRIWFLQSPTEFAATIQFPRLVKPLFPSMAGAEEPFTIRVQERGCEVAGLKLAVGRSFCFGGSETRPSSGAPSEKVGRALTDAVIARDGKLKALGTLATGTELPRSVGEGAAVPREPRFEAWKRFLGGDGLFGVFAPGAAGSVTSPDLAEALELPRLFIQRFK